MILVIVYLKVFITLKRDGGLFVNSTLAIINALIHGNIHLLDQDAVRWYPITLANIDDIPNN
jgi:hypothetical protein